MLEIHITDNLSAIIINDGNEEATDIEWKIRLDCTLLLVSLKKQCTGTLDKLKSGDEETITFHNPFLFGFGVLDLTATANAANAKQISDTQRLGFLYAPFLLGFP